MSTLGPESAVASEPLVGDVPIFAATLAHSESMRRQLSTRIGVESQRMTVDPWVSRFRMGETGRFLRYSSERSRNAEAIPASRRARTRHADLRVVSGGEA